MMYLLEWNLSKPRLGCRTLKSCIGRVSGRVISEDVFLYMEARMTVIWINIMITTSTNGKQDSIFDCCQ